MRFHLSTRYDDAKETETVTEDDAQIADVCWTLLMEVLPREGEALISKTYKQEGSGFCIVDIPVEDVLLVMTEGKAGGETGNTPATTGSTRYEGISLCIRVQWNA